MALESDYMRRRTTEERVALRELEAGVGIEPAYTALQAAA
jgi:hypothetical protein